MVRNRKLARKKGLHSGDNMFRAIQMHRQGTSLRNAAKECHINYGTLHRYIKKYKNIDDTSLQGQRLTPNYGINKTFTDEQEISLTEYAKEYALKFDGVSSKDVRRIAYQMATVNHIHFPPNWRKEGMAGIDWFRTYKLRHPDLKLKKPVDHTTEFDEDTVRIELEQRAKENITKIVLSDVKEDHHVADGVTNNPAEDSESDLDVSSDIVIKKEIEEKDKRNITTCSDEAYSNALATGVNVIIARVYKFFKREYEYLNKNYGEVFDITSFSNYEVRTAEATGFEIDVISRALEELEIQDGCPKKRKVEEENDSKLCVYTHNVERHNATDLNVSIALGPGDNCQQPKQPNLSYTPDVYEPPPGTSGVASLAEGFVIYEMQSKPTEELCIKVENVENYEEMQEMNRISEDSKDPLKMQVDYIENAESQVPKAVVRNPLGIETVNFQSTEHIPDGGVLIKEELDIVDEEFG